MIPKLTCLGALVSFLFLPSSFLPAQLAQPNGAGLSARVTVSVADFGAVSDGRTDSTEPLKRAFAFAASHSGTRLHFPCAAAGNTYLITSPLALPEHAALVGDHGTDCKILY